MVVLTTTRDSLGMERVEVEARVPAREAESVSRRMGRYALHGVESDGGTVSVPKEGLGKRRREGGHGGEDSVEDDDEKGESDRSGDDGDDGDDDGDDDAFTSTLSPSPSLSVPVLSSSVGVFGSALWVGDLLVVGARDDCLRCLRIPTLLTQGDSFR